MQEMAEQPTCVQKPMGADPERFDAKSCHQGCWERYGCWFGCWDRTFGWLWVIPWFRVIRPHPWQFHGGRGCPRLRRVIVFGLWRWCTLARKRQHFVHLCVSTFSILLHSTFARKSNFWFIYVCFNISIYLKEDIYTNAKSFKHLTCS